VKRRGRPGAGSITEALDSFRSEVRFYQEIAPVAGVRVPACYGELQRTLPMRVVRRTSGGSVPQSSGRGADGGRCSSPQPKRRRERRLPDGPAEVARPCCGSQLRAVPRFLPKT
jgi:hypothetical protein